MVLQGGPGAGGAGGRAVALGAGAPYLKISSSGVIGTSIGARQASMHGKLVTEVLTLHNLRRRGAARPAPGTVHGSLVGPAPCPTALHCTASTILPCTEAVHRGPAGPRQGPLVSFSLQPSGNKVSHRTLASWTAGTGQSLYGGNLG